MTPQDTAVGDSADSSRTGSRSGVKALSALSRRTILAGSVAGAGAIAFATPALAAGDLTAVPRLPGEVSRLSTATSKTGGKRYEIIDVVVAGDRARLFVPHATPPSQTRGASMLWYYHARNGTHTALSSAFAYSADLAVDRGIVSICPTYGGSIWSSPRAIEIQAAVAAWASSVWRIDASLLRSDSGGGPLLAWAYGKRMVPNIRGAYLCSSSYDMEERAASEPDKIGPEYADAAAIAATNPARLPASVWRGARLRITGSPDDVMVPLALHGAALHAAALPLAKEATLRTHPGEGTDGHKVPSFTNKEMIDTFQRWIAEGPVPQTEPVPETPPVSTLPGAGTYENGAAQIVTTGTWTTLKATADSGGSIAYSTSSGASATLAFTGTSIAWISRLTSSSGINDVELDGVKVASVDRYSASARSKQTVWSSGQLAAGPHTLTIRRGSSRNPASTGSNLLLDSFVVGDATPPPATTLPGAGTYENGAAPIVTTGTWSTLKANTDSGGSIAYSTTAGASATLAFTGTSVSWISRLTGSSGINDVELDGVTVASVDRYSAATRSKQTVWSSGQLAAGPHTVTIRRGSGRNPSSSGTNLILDAFVVGDAAPVPTVTVPTPIAEWSFAESAAPFASAVAGAPALRQGAGSSARAVATPFGTGVALNGTTDHLVVPKGEVGPLNLGASTGQVTIAVWVLNSDADGACIAGVWEESTVGPLRSYALFNNLPEYGGWERVCMHVSKLGGPTPGYPYSRDYSVEPRRITRGVWQLHVGTYDGAVAVSYLDGAATAYPVYTDKLGATYAKNPYVYPDGLNAAPGDFVVGAVGRDGTMINRFAGSLARLRVWDRALTAEQVKQLYSAEKGALG
ncbi:hypothetical protein C5D36_15005 [Rathayibacter sp. AY1C6]|uniref:LamG-like jellyroll fold domain-containing protein n=1 Tax=Rathayibacter sp. AY1C6 TaxID=2080539 RepID=UPI000CE7DCFA|nr:LamG-like jellyroll fold domain-containing protein [Rathayibacter sp. AY1C6]PPG12482.1 hypothetical protein C5D36_15005 [Rathayibacter sp. AY1C6]